MSSEKFVEKVAGIIEHWLRPDNYILKEAIDKTIDQGLFSFEDIKHQLLSLKHAAGKESLKRWVGQSRIRERDLNKKKVLCLHAGNIPLVGFQDALAVVLSQATYAGKISRKDPYLLPTFLELVKKEGLSDGMSWSVDLRTMKNFQADAILFSGSGRSIAGVETAVNELDLLKKDGVSLIRTDHYSIAYVDNTQPKSMKDLTEAVFRYGGRGCRSVAVVIAPFSLNSEKCEFTDYVESYWLKNPQHEKPPRSLEYRFAYNKSVGHAQSWLDDFLIEETEMKPEEEFVLHWVRGGPEKVREFIANYGKGLQSVYRTHTGIEIPGLKQEPELLSTAQRPPIDWKPDGIDTLMWLKNHL